MTDRSSRPPVDEPPRSLQAYDFALHRLAPDVGLLTYTARDAAGLSRRSSIWIRRGPGWRVVFHQGTTVDRGPDKVRQGVPAKQPSLEDLVESGLVHLDGLHPGGLALTEELATLCRTTRGARVLDVACGSGESACHLAEAFGARVCGLDQSDRLLAGARARIADLGGDVVLCRGDAHALPFAEGTFDIALCECTLCLLDKTAALREMRRVVHPGGFVGMHDLAWHDQAPDALKRRLMELAGEEPATEDGWRGLFTAAGLTEIQSVDRSDVKDRWMRDTRRRLGWSAQLRLGLETVRRWGVPGLWAILRSEHVFENRQLGYVVVVGRRPDAD